MNINLISPVSSINSTNKVQNSKPVSFKSYWDDDDNYWEDNKTHNYLRDHFFYTEGKGMAEFINKIPPHIETEQLSDEELKKLNFQYNNIAKLHISNFTIAANKKGVRGATVLEGKNKLLPKYIKNAGINQIIDLRARNSKTIKEGTEICEKNNIEYFPFPISYETKIDEQNVQQFPDFIKAMNKGNYYIACNEGLNRTDIAIALNYLFNPEEEIAPKFLSSKPEKKFELTLEAANKILSKDQEGNCRVKDSYAQAIGWENAQEMIDNFTQRLELLKQKNFLE